MFEPDEYLFTKLAGFFKRRKKAALEDIPHTVKLSDIKSRLSIVARAVSGEAIEIFPAELEGGYKNNSFFLPERCIEFPSTDKNIAYYLFRTLYLCVQKKLDYNFSDSEEYSLEQARTQAKNNSNEVLTLLFQEFPSIQKIYKELSDHFQSKSSEKEDLSHYIYGKWMRNIAEDKNDKKALENISEKAKQAIQNNIETILKANAVEEMENIELDKKAQEDYVLTHNFEKVETAEEYDGGWRDFDGDDDLEDHQNALEDLNMKHTVRVDDLAHSVYQADFIENSNVSESAEKEGEGKYLSYDEWDYSKQAYLPEFCKLYPKTQIQSNPEYYKKTIREHASVLMGLRKMLSSINNKYHQQRRQVQGESFDLDALTDFFVDVHSRHTASENIYLSKRKKDKDLSILILLDISLSSDGFSNGNRVLDVEKQVSILFGEILEENQVDFSINCFYSKTRNYASFLNVKAFDEDWNKAKHKIGAVEACGYTRIGTALRHAGALLNKRDAKNKWVLLISDGKPNDYDKYEGKHGINDVKQALRELNQMNINSYALAIEAQARYYLPQMFGNNHYQILSSPKALLEALAGLYERIKYKS